MHLRSADGRQPLPKMYELSFVSNHICSGLRADLGPIGEDVTCGVVAVVVIAVAVAVAIAIVVIICVA
jgi:hypothetical protein